MCFLKKIKFLLLFLFFIIFNNSIFAAPKSRFEITAKKIETFNNFGVIIAEGDVVISDKTILIWAQEVKYEIKTGYVILKNFKIFDKERQIIAEGDKGFLDVRNGELWSDHIFIFLKKQRIRIKAKDFHKNSLNEYFAKKALITTCSLEDCEKEKDFPPWSVELDNIVLTSQGISSGDSTKIRIKKIPVVYIPKTAYFPKVSLPIAPPRKTGFLTPGFAQGNRLGFGIQVPFFWAITDQLDFTISPMYLTQRGLLWDLENEFKISEGIQSIFKIRYLNDTKKQEYVSSKEKRHKWWVIGKIDSVFKSNLDAHLDIDVVSEKDFLQEFDVGEGSYTNNRLLFLQRFNRDIEDKSQEYRTSKFWIQYFKNSIYTKVESRYLDYHGNLDEDQILQPVLSLQADLLPFDIYKNILAHLALNYFYNTRKEGYYGHKLNSKIELSYPFNFSQIFNEIIFRYNLDFYNLSKKGDFGKKSLSRNFYEFNLTSYVFLLKNYKFLTIFNQNLEFLHILKPYISYFYRNRPSETDVPQFTYEDLISDKTNAIEFGLWQFFSFPHHKNLFIIRAYQQYDFTKAERSATATGPEDRALSDLYLQVLINYAPYLNVRYDGTYNFYGLGFKKHSLTLGLRNILIDSINLGYQDDSAWHTRQLTLNLRSTFFNRFQTNFFISRNLIKKETTEMRLEGVYLHECYLIGLGIDVTPRDTKFFFRFELKGLGGYGFGY